MDLFNNIQPTGLSPIIKWAGGKEKELPTIIPHAPQGFVNYYEPFVGGGSVFMAFPAKKYFINDKSDALIGLYRSVATESPDFFDWMNKIIASWSMMLDFVKGHRELCDWYKDYREDVLSDSQIKNKLLGFVASQNDKLTGILSDDFVWHRDVYSQEIKKNLTRKIARMKKIEKEKHIMPDQDVYDNIETALMSALYMYYRCLYNNSKLKQSNEALGTALFVFIRNYAYSGMFRYNDKGEFNVPYGGIGYNHKSLDKKMKYYKTLAIRHHFADTSIFNLDFEDFLRQNPPQEEDFVFLDPPYDSEFSTYAQNEFSKEDQKRLANYLINECKGKWMMVIKYTPFIYSLYEGRDLRIEMFDKKYLVSFMNRNDKKAEHLIIMNY